MFLCHYRYDGGVRRFDEVTGAVSTPVDRPREEADWGFVWRESARWYAIRKDHQSLIFQTGPRSWRLRNGVEFKITRGWRRRIQILRDGVIEFDLRYSFHDGWAVALDPTYDGMDEESDDFFLYVYQMWRAWKDGDIADFMNE
jgi:hypothetical protein